MRTNLYLFAINTHFLSNSARLLSQQDWDESSTNWKYNKLPFTSLVAEEKSSSTLSGTFATNSLSLSFSTNCQKRLGLMPLLCTLSYAFDGLYFCFACFLYFPKSFFPSLCAIWRLLTCENSRQKSCTETNNLFHQQRTQIVTNINCISPA